MAGRHAIGTGALHRFRADQRSLCQAPAGTVETLVKPENKAMLTKIPTYHVVPGKMSAAMLAKNAAKHGGKAMLTTAGRELTVTKGRTDLGGLSMPRG